MVPFFSEPENEIFAVEPGDIGYYPGRQTICIFYGDTEPFGRGERVREGDGGARRARAWGAEILQVGSIGVQMRRSDDEPTTSPPASPTSSPRRSPSATGRSRPAGGGTRRNARRGAAPSSTAGRVVTARTSSAPTPPAPRCVPAGAIVTAAGARGGRAQGVASSPRRRRRCRRQCAVPAPGGGASPKEPDGRQSGPTTAAVRRARSRPSTAQDAHDIAASTAEMIARLDRSPSSCGAPSRKRCSRLRQLSRPPMGRCRASSTRASTSSGSARRCRRCATRRRPAASPSPRSTTCSARSAPALRPPLQVVPGRLAGAARRRPALLRGPGRRAPRRVPPADREPARRHRSHAGVG